MDLNRRQAEERFLLERLKGEKLNEFKGQQTISGLGGESRKIREELRMLGREGECGKTRDLTINRKEVAHLRRTIGSENIENNVESKRQAIKRRKISAKFVDGHSKASDFGVAPPKVSLNWPLTAKLTFVGASMWRRSILLALMALLASSTLNFNNNVGAIKLQPEGKEKFYWSGEQFVITCQNNNNIKNVKFRWIGPNNTDITEHRWERVHAESVGPHSHRLVVMNATENVDDGHYKCQLGSTDDRIPRETTDFHLKLFKTTSFKETPKRMVLPVASKGVLNCHVEFDPNVFQPTVSWHRDQRPIEMFNDSTYAVTEYDASRQLSQLTIRPLTRKHDGLYTCRAAAITTHLSKISEHDIQLEINYAPSFELNSPQTIWVERLAGGSAGARRAHEQPAGHPGTGSSYHRHGRLRTNAYGAGSRRPQAGEEAPASSAAISGSAALNLEQAAAGNDTQQVVRVELKCACQSNPPASIIWTDSQSKPFVLAKGAPAHVLEEPRTEVEGHNTTSVLVVGYNLAPNWPHKDISYFCSASNSLGEASMEFKIEQGDPPPAFNVAAHKAYSPESSIFRFTISSPNFDPDSPNQQASGQQQQQILPPVDSFRIRAESSSASASDIHQKSSRARPSHASSPADAFSVQWSLPAGSQLSSLPQTFNVSLGRLPAGNQRLFLEAHNAVGWSPNATFLGSYFLVSGASSSNALRGISPAILTLVLSSLLVLGYGLLFGLSSKKQAKPLPGWTA